MKARAMAMASSVPTLYDLTLDEAHGLIYGSDPLEGKIWIGSLPGLATVATIDMGNGSIPLGMNLAVDGATLAVARAGLGDIALLDTASKSVIETLIPQGLAGPNVPTDVRFGRTGRLYSVGRGDTTGLDYVHVFNTQTGVEVGRSTEVVRGLPRLAITADGNTLFIGGVATGIAGAPPEAIDRFDVSTDMPTLTAQTPAGLVLARTLAIKPDGNVVYTTSGQVWKGDLSARLGTVPTSGPVIDYVPSTDQVVFAKSNRVTRADGTSFALLGSWTIGGISGPVRVNAAGTIAYVSTDANGVQAIDFRLPGAPFAVAARAGIGSALVSWAAPLSGTASPITSYDVISPGIRVSVPASQTSVVLTGLSPDLRTFIIDAVNSSGTGPVSAPGSVTPIAGGTYHPVSPARILDTRIGLGAPTAPIGSGGALNVQVGGLAGVPTSAVSAVVVNVTVTDTSADSFLTVWPAGQPRPETSNLNWVAGQTVPNLVQVALPPSGQLSLQNLGGVTDVVMDVEGWVGDSTNSSGPLGMFNSLTPSRLLDTRSGNGAPAAPLGPGRVLNLQVTGRGGVPAGGVSAVVLNVIVTDTNWSSFLTVWPTGQPLPQASNLNWVAGQTVPNRVMVPVGANGQVSIFNLAGNTDVVVDVNGWFTDATNQSGGSSFVAVPPTRFYDTRNVPNNQLGGGQSRTVSFAISQIEFRTAPPLTALALNVTVTNTTAPSFLTVWPFAQPLPNASDLNWAAGQTVPNMVVAGLGDVGPSPFGPVEAFNLFNLTGLVDVVIDVTGYYAGTVQPTSP